MKKGQRKARRCADRIAEKSADNENPLTPPLPLIPHLSHTTPVASSLTSLTCTLNLTTLPQDILQDMAARVDKNSAIALALVSRTLYPIALPRIWRDLNIAVPEKLEVGNVALYPRSPYRIRI